MTFRRIRIEDIELKYSTGDFELLWDYIGENCFHGNLLYDSKYAWYECLNNDIVGLICLTENKYLPNSVHLSFIEIIIPLRGKGYGTSIIKELENINKNMYNCMTLQCIDSLKSFYQKFGFVDRTINTVPIMRKYLK